MDSMEFLKQAWSPLNLPTPFTPTLSVEELDKRITDLRAVEQWLSLNQNMLRNTIQALEVQRGTLSVVQTLSDSFGKAIKPGDDAVAQALARFAASSAQQAASGSTGRGIDPRAASAKHEEPVSRGDPVQAANVDPLAWWNLLQSNFQQIAQLAGNQATGADAEGEPAVKGDKGSKSTGSAGTRPVAKPKRRKPGGSG
jgi:hypothetical protein